MALTKRQREVFDFLDHFIAQHGYSPSLEEIARGIGCSSIATAHKHLAHLAAKGMIRRMPNRRRGVDLERDNRGAAGRGAGVAEVAMLGEVAAGQPIEAIARDETISVPDDLVRGRETFALRVRGDSMIEEHIRDGDVILVERTGEAENGQMVVALIDGRDVTVKTWHREDKEMVRLQPANAAMKPLILPAERVAIHGRVIGLLRKY